MSKAVLVVATGLTLSNFPLGLFRGLCPVVAVNDAYKWAPWADIIYGCDREWWEWHLAQIKATCGGRRVALDVEGHGQIPDSGIEYVKNLGRNGFSRTPGMIFSGHNSGFQGLQVARLNFPSAEVFYLAGFDMGATGDSHCFGDHPPEIDMGRDWSLFIPDFDHVPKDMIVKLVTSPSALSFPTISVEEAVRELLAA